MRRYVTKQYAVMFDEYSPSPWLNRFSLKRWHSIVVDMPGHPIGFDIDDRIAADNLWPINCQRQMIHRRSTASRERQTPHFSLSRIFSSPARAQVSSNLAPGAPLAPIAPMVSSPSLMTTPPPKNRTCGSLDNGAISPLPRSSKAIVSLLNETLV